MVIDKKGGTTVFTPAMKQIDIMNSEEFGALLLEAVGSDGDCVIDMRNVLFLDSSGLGKIVSALRAVNGSSRRIVLCGMSEAVSLLFRMVQLSQIATFAPDVDAALVLLGVSA